MAKRLMGLVVKKYVEPAGLVEPVGLVGPVGPVGLAGLAGLAGLVEPVGLVGPVGLVELVKEREGGVIVVVMDKVVRNNQMSDRTSNILSHSSLTQKLFACYYSIHEHLSLIPTLQINNPFTKARASACSIALNKKACFSRVFEITGNPDCSF